MEVMSGVRNIYKIYQDFVKNLRIMTVDIIISYVADDVNKSLITRNLCLKVDVESIN